MQSIIKDIALADAGIVKIEWARKNMPILAHIEKDFIQNRVFKGQTILVCVHIEAKTARLVCLLRDSGAHVVVCGCNPLSTQDDVAAGLAIQDGITVYAHYGASEEEYFAYIHKALDMKPSIIIDDGGDVVHTVHTKRPELTSSIYGGCEETTTGVVRLKAMAKEGALSFPMISVNDAYCKYLFDNRYGTGQSVWDGINRTTNLIVCGKNVVIAGYGWCGKGCAMRAKGLGAHVIVCEVNPIKSIEAIMDGFTVMPMDEACALGDIFVTLTGCRDVIVGRHFAKMKDGAILANAGHFDVEICIPHLEQMAEKISEVRTNITAYTFYDGKNINLLAKGRLVNLAAGDGHPAEIMDMSFAVQALCAKYMLDAHMSLENKVYDVPASIDQYVATIKLSSMQIQIDALTLEQQAYISSWDH